MAFSDHVKVIFGADSKGFQTELGKAHDKAKDFKNKMGTLLTGAIGAAAFTKGADAVLQYSTELSNMATRLGVSTTFLQQYNFAANQSGVNTNNANTALQRFLRRAAEAKDKAGPLRDTLEKLGIKFTDLNGNARDGEALFREFGIALGKIEDPSEKLRTAFQFLDTEGVALTQMFTSAKDPIKELGEEAQRLGLILDQDTVEDLKKVGDELEALKTTFITSLTNGIAPFITKLSSIKAPIAAVITKIGQLTPAILLATTAFIGLKVAAGIKATLTALGIGLGTVTTALGITRGAVIALNTAIAANPFAAFVALLTGAVIAGLTFFITKMNDAENALGNVKDKVDNKLNPVITQLENKLDAAARETQRLREELQKLDDVDVDLGIDDLQDKLHQAGKEIDANIGKLQSQIDKQKETTTEAQEWLMKLQDAGAVQSQIDAAQEDLLTNQIKLQTQEQKMIGLLTKRKTVENQILEVNKQIQQNFQAQALKIDDLFDGSSKVTIELRRQKDITQALKDGGEELVEETKLRHEWEDKVVQLVKDEKLTIVEAARVANELVGTKKEQKRILGEIKQAEINAKEEAQKRDGVEADILAKLEAQLRAQKDARAEADQQLAVLRLRAAGEQDKADLLQKQLDLEKEIKRVMNQQGLDLQGAVAKIDEKKQLENDIKLKLIEQQIEEKKMGQIRDLANIKIRDAIDNEEKKRIRKANKIMWLEEQILLKKGEQNDMAVKQVEEWEKIKDREVTLLLDDATQEDLDNLRREKVQLQDNHQQNLDALAAAQNQVQADQIAAQAQAQADRQAVALENAAVAQKVKDLNEQAQKEMAAVGAATVTKIDEVKNDPKVKDAVNNSKDVLNATIKECCAKIVTAIGDIKLPTGGSGGSAPPPVVAPPTVINQVTVNIQSELKQETQEEILETLEGYFVNQ